jgi:hypothetical protein
LTAAPLEVMLDPPHMRSRIAGALILLFLVLPASVTRVARAEDAARLKSAADEFDKGRRAFQANDFETAAVHFENAYRDAPRAEALRPAIKARLAAKQPSKAATLSAFALARYDDPQTSELAKKTLAETAPALHAVSVACNPECALAIDGRLVSIVEGRKAKVYTEPGPHELLVTWPQDRAQRVKVQARAGGATELSLEAPPVPKAAESVPTGVGSSAPDAPRKPLPPIVFYIGAAATVAAAGVTVWSGLDAKNNPGVEAVRRDCVGQGESCATYQQGKSAELRTNVLLGVTGGLAIGSAVIGLLFTQWSKPAERRGGLTPTVAVADPRQSGIVLGLAGAL